MINGKSRTEIIRQAQISTADYFDRVYFESAEEAAEYDRDPDAWAAQYFGITKNEYSEWVECHGLPRCAHIKRNGGRCQAVVGKCQRNPRLFFQMHRKCLCRVHEKRQ